ncbi:MAG: fluoride efflux transporter CrcB [Nitrospinae bacterium]|nr:fluoride efflux transporter CrcB [Nitrospinota bacterium]
MMKLLLVAIGGAIGSVTRYLASGFTYRFVSPVFPWGTLAVNLAGSFLIGFLWEMCDRAAVSPNTRTLIFIGFLGGFTTFSSFSLESFNLIRDGEYKMALANVLASNLLGIALVFAGFASARYVHGLFKWGA